MTLDDPKYYYAMIYFASMIGMIGFLGIILGVILMIIKIFNSFMLALTGGNDNISIEEYE